MKKEFPVITDYDWDYGNSSNTPYHLIITTERVHDKFVQRNKKE